VTVAFYRFLLLADMVLLSIAGHGGGNLTHGSKYLTENAPDWVRKWVERGDVPAGGAATDSTSEYARVIQPIFEAKCYQCHGAEKQKGDYRMDTVEGLFAAGESGLDPIVKGNAVESYLVETITVPDDDDIAMPPDGKDRLTPEEVLAIMRWIWAGAETGS
jgi:mono/diheme cytochrome c family protein